MYEELVAVLRHCCSLPCEGCPRKTCEGALANMREAADAIEELVATVGTAYNELANNEASKPRWIPVTERLPEEERQVLAYYGFNRGDGHLGMMFMQVMDYYIDDPRPHFQHEGLNGLTVTHWMPLPKAPEPPKEEA